MRLLLLGDIVGRAGREVVLEKLPQLRRDLFIDFVMINAENAAGGFGLTPVIANELFEAGADVLTLGNHSWDQREMLTHIGQEPRIIRPLNYPAGTPGQGSILVTLSDRRKVLVIQAIGRLFMDAVDCPFQTVHKVLSAYRLGHSVDAIVIDMHAEGTSEKQAMGHFLDGRVSAVVGTHTHTPTADTQILPQGTAYHTDLGMCGDYNSVIGFEAEAPVARFIRKMPGERLRPALGEGTIAGLVVETNDKTGLASSVQPLRIGGRLIATH